MLNNYYDIYLKDTLRLAETISIKFEDAATAVNAGVIATYGPLSVDPDNPQSWKYYQNISGAYHITDTKMSVTSADDLSTIVFSKEALKVHVNTKATYQYGTRPYVDLVNRYPAQETLILGILYAPEIDTFIDDVIASDCGTILYYPSKLVESGETDFIVNLQKWIYSFMERWVIRRYGIIDNLYAAGYMAQLYMSLVPAMLNIRLSACKTNKAHSFHIRQYLASHGMLDKYLDVMTREQALFFYRNILYIQKNSGKKDTLAWLVENLMTKRSLPLFEYTAKHDLAQMLPNEYATEQLNLFPEVMFKRNALNFRDSPTEKSSYSFAEMLNKIEVIAPGNLQYHEDFSEQIENKLKDSLSSVVRTKTLESIVDDNSDIGPYTFESLMLNHWIYWACTGKYTTKTSVTFPNSKNSIALSARQVLILYVYAANKAAEKTLVTIPKLMTWRVLRDTPPTLEELKSVTEREYVTDDQLQVILDSGLRVIADPSQSESEDIKVIVAPMLSIDSFYYSVEAIYTATIEQHGIECSNESGHTIAQFQLATSKMYNDVVVTLAEDIPDYDTWLRSFGISLDNYKPKDYHDLCVYLLDIITGASANNSISIKKVQRAMIEMLSLLSSYSIQVISDVNDPTIEFIPARETCVLDSSDRIYSDEYVETAIFEQIGDATIIRDDVPVDVAMNEELITEEYEESKDTVPINLISFDLNSNPFEDETIVEMTTAGAIGYEDPMLVFSSLTTDQKRQIASSFI
jgi:hypothetical protein